MFYKYLTKYIKLVAHKKEHARILEMLGKFWPFLLKKRAFRRKVGAVMLMYTSIFEEIHQKSLERR